MTSVTVFSSEVIYDIWTSYIYSDVRAANRTNEIAMKVTVKNWKEVECKIRNAGVKDAICNSNGELETIITKNGEQYEVSKELFFELQKLDIIEMKPGTRTEPKRK